jgi:hypothetical protein
VGPRHTTTPFRLYINLSNFCFFAWILPEILVDSPGM